MQNFPVSFRRVAVFAGIFILFLLVVEFNTRLEELNRLSAQRDEMRLRATQSVQTQLALQTRVAYAQSTAAVEEWARTEGHYAREGDHPIIPVEVPGSEPVVVATPTVIPTPLENWEIWWKLFFEE
jgi:hypothetical protein